MARVSDLVLQTQRKRSIVFLMSDFLQEPDKKAIGHLNFRHELIPVRIHDHAELELPAAGRITFRDPESGAILQGNLSDSTLRAAHAKAMKAHLTEWERTFTQLGIDILDTRTADDFIPQLRTLFNRRSRLFVR